ncbi:hypothetical protein FRZ67_20885 [Panacibacter ginsenosidivorans]|uniref:HTH luxR-type domain-containing protein n=1 Tax=Panacibacter ginsenosidivorans TaxID=1813871 RepID=A0A5B8VDN1_9BACT|nr:LuxR C-terminal-related transcriptional regulator [Panacibacter ginsenosidivorans]QEC69637.1 hypothetical protein FRZ67_20885 [Panacibacter ginsenosidivorans]
MKPKTFDKEFNKMFTWFTNETSEPGLLKLELDLYKKLWSFFLAGDSYYFVLNHHSLDFDFVSSSVENVLGYAPTEFTFEFINEKLHPDDQPWFVSLGYKVIEFLSLLSLEKLMKYKLRYDVRYRKKNGEYARMLYQGVIIEHDETGRLLRTLGINTDITYLKKEGKPVLSFIGMDGEPSYINIDLQNTFLESREDFTAREKEVLKLLIEGKLSKQISSILNISKQTVDTHRKNMLHKKKLSNTGELVGKAIMYGWI